MDVAPPLEAVVVDAVGRARAIAPVIGACADELERTQRFPQPLLDAVHAARLFHLLLPRAAGGEEVEPWTYFDAVAEVARHDASVGWCMFVANSSAIIAAFLALPVARDIFADPRATIAWGPPNAHRATAVPGGYRVTGRWDFASGCRHARWMGAHCNVAEPDGSLRLNRAGRPTVRTLLFPIDSARLIHSWDVIGLRGTASDSYEVEDVFVPEPFSTTREDPTLRREPGRLYAFTMQGLYAVGVSGVAIGTAQAMLEEFKSLARAKTPRGLGRLADNAVVQSNVARMEAKLGAARAFMTQTLRDAWDGVCGVAPIDVPARAQVRLACAQAILAANEVADASYKAAGVSAIFDGSPFVRRFRDMHTLLQQIQSREAHFEAVGQILLGIEPAGEFL
jgi:alkylation response protein AidB-like acyl-CoA dehydrogenase